MKRVERGIVKIILVLIALLSIEDTQSQKVIDKVIAVVGNEAILQSDMEQRKLEAMQRKVVLTKDLECSIYEELLFEKLLIHQAEIDSVEVTEAQVKAQLEQRIQYFSSQMPNGIEGLEEFYKKSIEEIKDEFYEVIESNMKAQQMQQIITENAKVSPKEVNKFFKSFPDDSIPLIERKVEISKIQIKPEVTEEEKKAIKKELNEIRDKIIAGTLTFNIAAQFYSCDPGSKDKGGDFGWVKRGSFVPEFEAVAFTIEPGKVSEVFETQYGYHITEIEAIRGEQFKGRHILLCFKPSTDELIKAKLKLDSIKKEIEAGNLGWKDAVIQYSDDDMTKGSQGKLFNVSTGMSLWSMSEIDPVTFQGIDNLEVGEISKPMLTETFDGEAYQLLKLNKRTQPHRANLTDDYQLIQSFALQRKKSILIRDWVNSKVGDVYIRIDEGYRSCDFQYKWIGEN